MKKIFTWRNALCAALSLILNFNFLSPLALGALIPPPTASALSSPLATNDINSADPSADHPETELPPKKLYISALNSGYSNENASENFDFIELSKLIPEDALSEDASDLPLAGFSLLYFNSKDDPVARFDLPRDAILTKKTLVLGSKYSPQVEKFLDSPLIYDFGKSGLSSLGGRIELQYRGARVDYFCWGSNTACKDSFIFEKIAHDQAHNKSIRRCRGKGCNFASLSSSYYKYYPLPDLSVLKFIPHEEIDNSCDGLRFNELYSFYLDHSPEQFIEIFNAAENVIRLETCQIKYKKNNYKLSGALEPGAYFVYQNPNLILTKNPSKSNTLLLTDLDGNIADEINYYHGQKRGTSFALFNLGTPEEKWLSTYARTPGKANVFQQFRTCANDKVINPRTGHCVHVSSLADPTPKSCPEGKYLNPLTNRCKAIPEPPQPKTCAPGYYLNANTKRCLKIREPKAPVPCKEGYVRSPETKRCRKINSSQTKELTPCKEGYIRNPETKRCHKLVDSQTLSLLPCLPGYVRNPDTKRCRKLSLSGKTPKPCQEGYERNPDTNRCRKIRAPIVANLGVDQTPKSDGGGGAPNDGVGAKIFTAIATVGAIAVLGAGYAIFVFRGVITRFALGLWSRFSAFFHTS